jgi:polyisoprenoid-binding protein YceI
VLGAAPLHPTWWAIEPSLSRVDFTVRHLGVPTLAGTFRRFSGSIRTDTSQALRQLELIVDAHSLDTGAPWRDEQLRAHRIFGSDEHPTLEFRSHWSYEKGKGREGVQGSLRMHGQTHVLQLVADPPTLSTDEAGRRWYATTVSGVLDRRQWGVSAHHQLDIGGLLVGHEVHVLLRLHALIPSLVADRWPRGDG